MKRPFAVLAGLILCSSPAFSQAKITASRAGDLQIGGGFTTATSDYVPNRIKGYTFYSDFDFREHFGVEVDFHQLGDHATPYDPTGDLYERSYEVGGRYVRRYRQFRPYAKLLYGRGVFNFENNVANLAYNMFVGGAGVDIVVHPRVNIRADFEYQKWLSAPGLYNGLTPTLITIGAAYHFPAGNPR